MGGMSGNTVENRWVQGTLIFNSECLGCGWHDVCLETCSFNWWILIHQSHNLEEFNCYKYYDAKGGQDETTGNCEPTE